MRYRTLHGTNLQLSELGFGTWTLTTGWWGTYTDDEARRLIRIALDAGINYIDTADAYGNGRGETMLAPLLKEHPDVIVGTKFGYDFYNNPERPRGQRELPQDMSPKFIRFAIEQSLKRLGVDHVAIYQPHNPRVVTLMEDEHWETLESLKSEGKDPLLRPVARPGDRLARRRHLRERRAPRAGDADDLQRARAGSRAASSSSPPKKVRRTAAWPRR